MVYVVIFLQKSLLISCRFCRFCQFLSIFVSILPTHIVGGGALVVPFNDHVLYFFVL